MLISKSYKRFPRRLKKLFNIRKNTQIFIYTHNISKNRMLYMETKKYHGFQIFVFQYYENKNNHVIVIKKTNAGIEIIEHYINKIDTIQVNPTVVYISEKFYRKMQQGLPYKKHKKINEIGILDVNKYINKEWQEFISTVQSSNLLLKLYFWKSLGFKGQLKNEELKKEIKKLRGNLFYYLLRI